MASAARIRPDTNRAAGGMARHAAVSRFLKGFGFKESSIWPMMAKAVKAGKFVFRVEVKLSYSACLLCGILSKP